MDTESNALPDAKTLFERMCIDGTRFQAQKFMSAVESYEGLSEAVNQGEEITPNYLPLLSDVFSSFFQNKARLKQNPPRETEENREIMETALGLKEYEELHTVSRLDFFASAAATRAFSDQIIKLIKEKKEEDKKDPEKGKTNNGPLGVDPDTLRWAIRRSLKKGLEEAQEAKQAVETFGREEGGIQRIPITEQFRLADLLGKNSKIKEIIKMLGRMRLEALSIKRSRITHSSPVRRGVETVGIEGIERVLPDELANLAIGEEGEDLFLKRLLEEDLLAYSYKNPVERNTGADLDRRRRLGKHGRGKRDLGESFGDRHNSSSQKGKKEISRDHLWSKRKRDLRDRREPAGGFGNGVLPHGDEFRTAAPVGSRQIQRTTAGRSLFHHRRDLQLRGREKTAEFIQAKSRIRSQMLQRSHRLGDHRNSKAVLRQSILPLGHAKRRRGRSDPF